MRPKTMTLMLCTLLLACTACAGKGGGAKTPTPTPAPPVADAQKAQAAPTPSATCRLLTASDVRESQGEEPSDAQGSEHFVEGVAMSQCFYRLPTFNKSVNLEVVRAAPGSGAEAVREFWRRRFHPEAVSERERQRELREQSEREREEELRRERESGQVREGGRRQKRDKEAEASRPVRVAGVGDEAYWSGNELNAALSVLRKDTVVRLSVGGDEEQSVKIRKASELARKVLKRL